MHAVQHRSPKSRRSPLAALCAAGVLMLAACGSTTPPSAPPAVSPGAASQPVTSVAAPTDRTLTLKTLRGDVQVRVRPDPQLPGQFVAAFLPGLRAEPADSGASFATVVGAASGAAPTARVSFYSTDRSRFYLGDGADRYCVQVVRETENGGIVSMRFARAAEDASAQSDKRAGKLVATR